jgi:hypothetical protein
MTIGIKEELSRIDGTHHDNGIGKVDAAVKGIQSTCWDDLSVPSGCGSMIFPRELDLLRATLRIVVELQERGGAGAEYVADFVFDEYPEFASRTTPQAVETLATVILGSELPRESERFQKLFRVFNAGYFADRLEDYKIRVVFDLHTFANEPVFDSAVNDGLIRFAERCIYLRYSDKEAMEGTLIHEMAHAATNGDHGEDWLAEMARLMAAGAPVHPCELE